ncbi:hypothetical protein DPMN_053948 [Dreissena polymorpha]|uniref:Uncharacterized protein n=1 Tax=Dreissena polymorpha TaxID=45954 RepID=A0A9D4CP19_DREPO|nr:hypothetical protein DPMN_053948 [Dreissena polymorpha]
MFRTLNQVCTDPQIRDVLARIQTHIDVLEKSTARVSSRAEVYGAIQQVYRAIQKFYRAIQISYPDKVYRAIQKVYRAIHISLAAWSCVESCGVSSCVESYGGLQSYPVMNLQSFSTIQKFYRAIQKVYRAIQISLASLVLCRRVSTLQKFYRAIQKSYSDIESLALCGGLQSNSDIKSLDIKTIQKVYRAIQIRFTELFRYRSYSDSLHSYSDKFYRAIQKVYRAIQKSLVVWRFTEPFR